MNHLRSKYLYFWLGLLMAICDLSMVAQSLSLSAGPSSQIRALANTIYFRDIPLHSRQNQLRIIDVRFVASIRGRVFDDSDVYEKVTLSNADGVGGVRVILRSAEEKGSIVGNRISEADGTFEFPNLSPGKYTMEIDRISIPAKLSISNIRLPAVKIEASTSYETDLLMAAKNNITGIVFEDKDGDGQFTTGRDEPVKGASISVNGIFTRSNDDGRYFLNDLPPGRTALLVCWPKANENTQVIVYVDLGSATNRTVNIPRNR
jgi:hypothetical protein